MQDEKTAEMSGSRYSELSNSGAEQITATKSKGGIKGLFKKQFRKTKELTGSSPDLSKLHIGALHTASSPIAGNHPPMMFSEQGQDEMNFQDQFMQINKERQEMIRKFESEIKDLKTQLEAERAKFAVVNKLVEGVVSGGVPTTGSGSEGSNSNTDGISGTKSETGEDGSINTAPASGAGVGGMSEGERENASVTLLKGLTEENSKMSIKLKETEYQASEAQAQLKTMKLTLARYLDDNNSFKEMSQKDKTKIVELSDLNAKLGSDIQQKQRQLDEANASLKQMESGGAEITRLNHEVNDLKTKIKAVEEKLESEQTNSGMITKELDAARQECVTLRAEREKSLLDKANRQGQINTLATQLDETEKQRRKLEADLSDITDRHEKLQRDFDKQREEIKTLANADTQLKTIRCQTTQLKRELENERGTIKVLTTSLSNLSHKFGSIGVVDKCVAGLTPQQKDQLITYYIYNGRAKPDDIIQMIVDMSKDKPKKSKDAAMQQSRIQRDILEETLMQNITLKSNLEAVSREFDDLLKSLGNEPDSSKGDSAM